MEGFLASGWRGAGFGAGGIQILLFESELFKAGALLFDSIDKPWNPGSRGGGFLACLPRHPVQPGASGCFSHRRNESMVETRGVLVFFLGSNHSRVACLAQDPWGVRLYLLLTDPIIG